MKVSVIIPAYNEEKYIKDCIETLKNQTVKNIEIILIDDGSCDRTVEIAQTIGVDKIIKQKHKGAGVARNKGSVAAGGGILVFIDADMYLKDDAVELLMRPIKEGKSAGTFLIDEKVANPENYWSKMWSIAHNLPCDWRFSEKKRENIRYSDVFRAIKKDIFIKSGGNYEERATGQDKIADRVGQKALVVRGAIAYHYNPDTFGRAMKDAQKFGKGRIYFYKGFQKIGLILKYSIFRSVPVGILKGIIRKRPLFVFFKIAFDFMVLWGFITALFTKDTKE